VIVVDTSALVAIARHEPERERFLQALASESELAMTAVNWLETRIVLFGRMGEPGLVTLRDLVARAGVQLGAASAELADGAFDAFRRFGKGRHPAGLNICDCFAYALAKETGAPLLFKGDDFTKTDIAAAFPRPCSGTQRGNWRMRQGELAKP
jgi:ribonuclease VapC